VYLISILGSLCPEILIELHFDMSLFSDFIEHFFR